MHSYKNNKQLSIKYLNARFEHLNVSFTKKRNKLFIPFIFVIEYNLNAWCILIKLMITKPYEQNL